MAKDNEIDAKLLKFFYENEVLDQYVNEELKRYQIDEPKLDL